MLTFTELSLVLSSPEDVICCFFFFLLGFRGLGVKASLSCLLQISVFLPFFPPHLVSCLYVTVAPDHIP